MTWTPAAGRYESACGRFVVAAENDRWVAVDVLTVTTSPGFALPDAARAWCEARTEPQVERSLD